LISTITDLFERASRGRVAGDLHRYTTDISEAIVVGIQLHCLVAGDGRHWFYPHNVFFYQMDETERRFIQAMRMRATDEESHNVVKRDFIDWFVDLAERAVDKWGSDCCEWPVETLEEFLRGVYLRDLLVNFRAVRGARDLYRGPNPTVFFGDPTELTRWFKARGITTTLDFRRDMERGFGSLDDQFREILGVEPHWVNLNCALEEGTGYKGYVAMLMGCRERVVRGLRILLESPGAAFFHCVAGKDRTGAFAATIQSLLSVPTEVIVEDYRQSGYDARPQRIIEVLEHFKALGGVRTYLADGGFGREEQDAFVVKFKAPN
jgi:hypothetical protein